VNCPFCTKPAPDDASICPHCEAILDDSFLGEIPDEEGEDTPVPEVPAPRPAAKARASASSKKSAKPRRRAPLDEAPAEEPPEPAAAANGGYVNKYQQYWEEDDPPPAKANQAAPARAQALDPSAPSAAGEQADPMVLLSDAWKGILALGFEDKIAFGGCAALGLMSLMPWRGTPDGSELGILSWGFLTLLLSGAGAAAIWVRKKEMLQAVPRPFVPLATVGAGGLSAFIALVFIIFGGEELMQQGRLVESAWPTFGVYLTLFAAIPVILGGLLTFKRVQAGGTD